MADLKISALPASTTPLAGTEVVPLVQSSTTKKVAVSDLTAGRAVGVGSLSVNATPSSWATYTGVIDIGGNVAVAGFNQGLFLGANIYYNGSNYIYKTTTTAGFYQIAGNAHTWFTAPSGTAGTTATVTQNMGLGATGDLTLNTGNLVIGTSGKGIDFSATPGTGTSELLADYEEGTWTPVVTADTGSITTYSATGFYTKVGNIVELRFAVNVSNVGTASGAMRIAGLPFTSVSYADTYPAGTFLVRETGLTGQSYQGFNNANSTNAFVAALSGATIVWTNGVVYVFSGTYRAA